MPRLKGALETHQATDERVVARVRVCVRLGEGFVQGKLRLPRTTRRMGHFEAGSSQSPRTDCDQQRLRGEGAPFASSHGAECIQTALHEVCPWQIVYGYAVCMSAHGHWPSSMAFVATSTLPAKQATSMAG